MGILTYLEDTFFTINLNYPYIFSHIIPAFSEGVNHKPVIEHERDYYFLSWNMRLFSMAWRLIKY